jgi:hypothetical protein
MCYLPILAAAKSGTASGEVVVPQLVTDCWTRIASLAWPEAVLTIAFGMILLFHGWRIYKTLVVISFALIGLFMGMLIGDKAGSALWGAVLGMVVLGFAAVPLMQWAISILGAIAGGVLTASLWYAAALPDKYILAGALVGVVAGGMISFIVVKAAVTLFTSLQGALLITLGALALLAAWDQTGPRIKDIFFQQRWFFPVCLAVLTAVGVYIQTKFNKGGDGGGGKK